jgi:hypothetical protein
MAYANNIRYGKKLYNKKVESTRNQASKLIQYLNYKIR